MHDREHRRKLMLKIGNRGTEYVGNVIRGRVRVVIQSERLEGFLREVVRRLNREVALKVPGCESQLLSEEEWVILWRGLLATRCAYFDTEESYPAYRILRPKRAQIPGILWEALTLFGHCPTNHGADYYIVGQAEWPTVNQFNSVWIKWVDAMYIYLRVTEVSQSMPADDRAPPALILSAVERNGAIVIQSHVPIAEVTPRDTLWAALALPPVPDWAPPKTTYLEWDASLIKAEILREIYKEE